MTTDKSEKKGPIIRDKGNKIIKYEAILVGFNNIFLL